MQVLDQSTTKICSAKISVLKVDDANGNIAFICQRFYGLFLIKELGADQNANSTSKTSIQVNKTNN